AGGNNDHIRVFGEYLLRFGVHAAADFDAGMLELADTPIDDANELPPPRRRRRDMHLPTGHRVRLQHHHVVATPGKHTSGFQAGRVRTYNYGFLRDAECWRDFVCQRFFTPSRRVVDARGTAGIVNRVQTQVRADTGPDAFFVAGLDFRDDMR